MFASTFFMFAVTFLYLHRLFINLHRHFLCLQCPLRAIVIYEYQPPIYRACYGPELYMFTINSNIKVSSFLKNEVLNIELLSLFVNICLHQ